MPNFKMPVVRKTIRILKWIIICVFTVFTITVISFVVLMENSIDKLMTKERQKEFIYAINNSPELPKNFYVVIENYFPNIEFEQKVWESVFTQLISQGSSLCQCRNIYYHPGITDKETSSWWVQKFQTLIISLEIEENCSNKKCFEYSMSVSCSEVTNNETNDITVFAEKLFNKGINELTDEEIIKTLLILEMPFLKTNNTQLQEKADLVLKNNNQKETGSKKSK